MTSDTGYFDEVVRILDRWRHLGSRTVSNGTRLIGHSPGVGPLAYLHEVYGGLPESDIEQIEVAVQGKLPQALKQFYCRANGCYLFGGALSIYGLRRSYDRSSDDTSRQPFSIATPNIWERPTDADPATVFFGGFNWDGSKLFFARDQSIMMCPQRSAEPVLYRWGSFAEMLLAEVNRLALMFDDHGCEIDESAPTIPAIALPRGHA